MRILFVMSQTLIGADLSCRLKKEGHDIRVFIDDQFQKTCLDGMIEKTNDWEKDLEWVGKEDGLIVFDDVGYGKIQDQLRSEGYSVVGSSERGELLEVQRGHGQRIFSLCGLNSIGSYSFDNAGDAGLYVQENPGKWVIKQKDHTCTLNYVGQMNDGSDVLNVLSQYAKNNIEEIELQKKIDGVEVAVGRYFNGMDWIGPVCINFEHKPLFNGNIGPMTGEMGTLMWYEEENESALFMEVLSKLEDYLRHAKFKGYIDINCIVNEDGVWPIEATTRFGCPIVNLQTALQISPWGEILKSIADGKKYDIKYRKEYGIIVTVAVPPFPFFSHNSPQKDHSSENAPVFFKKDLSNDELKRVCFQQVCFDGNRYCVSGVTGEVMYVSGVGETVKGARENAYSLIENIIVPKMFYRTDIGEKFLNEDMDFLKKNGWIR